MSDVIICPRCGKPVKSIQRFRSNGRTYFRFYHGNGERCYVGPREYIYATRTQWRTLVIMGAVEVGREEMYIEGSIKAIREISSIATHE
jgi:hypothetical protein